ncbi:MAG: 4-hydroxy-3-methylbut-2-enyl diphosphate reductase, partial [Candidatus Thiodiazotropha taylori]
SLAKSCDLVLVVGSPNSSNSNRLREIAEKHGLPAYLIDGAEDIDQSWLTGKQTIGVTAGASAPEVLVESVIEQLKGWGAQAVVEAQGKSEEVVFALPKSLAGE